MVFGEIVDSRISALFLKSQSRAWPTAQVTVLNERVEKRPGGYLLSAPYWFYATGTRYGGTYERQFNTEFKAQKVLRRLRACPPMVRYRPGDPDTSILDDVPGAA